MPSELLTERRGTTLVLTISDPPTRNTLSVQVIAAGIEALGVAEANPEIRAVVVQELFDAANQRPPEVARSGAGAARPGARLVLLCSHLQGATRLQRRHDGQVPARGPMHAAGAYSGVVRLSA